MKKSSPYVMTSRQINIPYLLKIGEGKIAKIGKYLFDKDTRIQKLRGGILL